MLKVLISRTPDFYYLLEKVKNTSIQDKLTKRNIQKAKVEDLSYLNLIFEVDEKSILSCADVKEIIKSKLLPSVPATTVVKYFNNSSVYIKRKTVNNKTVQCLIGLKVK